MAHPEALPHTLRLGDRQIDFLLRRSRRRTIGLTVDHRGLVVGVPQGASLGDIERILVRHREWILRRLERRSAALRPIAVFDGMRLPWLGGELVIRLAVSGRTRWADDSTELTLATSPEKAQAVLEKALRTRIRQYFSERAADLSPRLGVTPREIALSSARQRWGSCSSQGVVRLNWRLGFLAPPLIDYVIVHELAHLREMNHGSSFWSLVERLCPDWREYRRSLRLQAPILSTF